MAKDKDTGEFWRGYVWGFIVTPLIVGTATVALSFVAAVVAGPRAPGAKFWGKDGDVPPPGPEPIDVEAN